MLLTNEAFIDVSFRIVLNTFVKSFAPSQNPFLYKGVSPGFQLNCCPVGTTRADGYRGGKKFIQIDFETFIAL
jgi:hypothetical protein